MIKTKYVAAVVWVSTAVILGILCSSCTTTGEPDWSRVAVELELGAADIRDAAALVTDETLALDLLAIASTLDAAAAQAATEPANVADAIDAGLRLCDTLISRLDPEHQADARAALLIARAALRRYKAYLPTDPTD